jgi:hypothetical protein
MWCTPSPTRSFCMAQSEQALKGYIPGLGMMKALPRRDPKVWPSECSLKLHPCTGRQPRRGCPTGRLVGSRKRGISPSIEIAKWRQCKTGSQPPQTFGAIKVPELRRNYRELAGFSTPRMAGACLDEWMVSDIPSWEIRTGQCGHRALTWGSQKWILRRKNRGSEYSPVPSWSQSPLGSRKGTRAGCP